MKNLIFILVCFFSACSVSKKNNLNIINNQGITYILSNKIISLFENKVDDSSYFCLYSDSTFYDLYICKGDNKFANRTNRKLFIKGKFYPLIFESDMNLATITSNAELIRKYRNGEYLEITKYVTIHEGFFVRFTKKGDVISKN